MLLRTKMMIPKKKRRLPKMPLRIRYLFLSRNQKELIRWNHMLLIIKELKKLVVKRLNLQKDKALI
jgi:hypothetical protein